MAAAVEVELLRRGEALRDDPLERDARVGVVAQVLLPLLREKDLLGLVAPLVEVAAHADTVGITGMVTRRAAFRPSWTGLSGSSTSTRSGSSRCSPSSSGAVCRTSGSTRRASPGIRRAPS